MKLNWSSFSLEYLPSSIQIWGENGTKRKQRTVGRLIKKRGHLGLNTGSRWWWLAQRELSPRPKEKIPCPLLQGQPRWEGLPGPGAGLGSALRQSRLHRMHHREVGRAGGGRAGKDPKQWPSRFKEIGRERSKTMAFKV